MAPKYLIWAINRGKLSLFWYIPTNASTTYKYLWNTI